MIIQYKLHTHLTFALFQTRDLLEAEEHAQNTLQIQPEWAGSHLALGLNYEYYDLYNKALTSYLKAADFPLQDQIWLNYLEMFHVCMREFRLAGLPEPEIADLPAPLKAERALIVLSGGEKEKSIQINSAKKKIFMKEEVWQNLYLPLL